MKKLLYLALSLLPSAVFAGPKEELIEQASDDLKIWAGMIPEEIKRVTDGAVTTPDTLMSFTKFCYEKVDGWKAAGVSDSDIITFPQYSPFEWRGTFAEIKPTFCEKGTAAIQAYYDTQLVEHRKVLKNDKYDMLKKQWPFGFFVPGNTEAVTDAKSLAKADAWFYIVTGEPCAINKNNYRYIRYQFDKEGKLKKTTEKSYCGDPGVKALK